MHMMCLLMCLLLAESHAKSDRRSFREPLVVALEESNSLADDEPNPGKNYLLDNILLLL